MTARKAFRFALTFFATLLLSASANAQLFRAYLAFDGNDGNPCTLPAPCRLLPAALNAVADGGEIWMLDSANYNTATVTIGKSVSILAVPGTVGSVIATGGPAISITASNLKVALRNLVIAPLAGGGGTLGVLMTGASTLFVENSLLANLPASGVVVVGSGKLKVTDTIIRNNGEFAVILQNGPSGEISGTKMLENAMGGILTTSATATTTTASVSDSVISGPAGGIGISVNAMTAGAVARAAVKGCTIEGLNFALNSYSPGSGSAVIAVGGSMISNNGYAWNQNGVNSIIRSMGNNQITDNPGTPTGVLTLTPLQ